MINGSEVGLEDFNTSNSDANLTLSDYDEEDWSQEQCKLYKQKSMQLPYRWIVDMEGAPGTLYEGEKFQLLFKFSSRYPFDSPQVMFTGDNIPVHPHIYSNGHICLSILTEDWSPALSVQSVCLSIISMLSSCKEKRRPPDNSFYVRTCNKNPKKTKWWYHDDTC
ncbi:ubiquitin-conjugating enzyme E2 W isoform X2 [Acipenser ruthenus]|uniref:ubiquitin-conjugating enzyme E2 W isoform X2 n=1 Tax=Acipenser ruthenus TaxID=7906 RepID=UPI001560D57A|nr:ubiquitin-conjugating enzyme E2 W isoform X2 [Acipenser ruthenus]